MIDSDNTITIRLERSGAFLVLSSLSYGGAGDRLELGGRGSSFERSECSFHGTLKEQRNGVGCIYIIFIIRE